MALNDGLKFLPNFNKIMDTNLKVANSADKGIMLL